MSTFVSLMYHNVAARRGPDGCWPGFADLSRSITSYFVDREAFARHCRLIAERGRLHRVGYPVP